jgi:hypothetical protein
LGKIVTVFFIIGLIVLGAGCSDNKIKEINQDNNKGFQVHEVNWEETYNGLKMHIKNVALTNQGQSWEDENEKVPVIKINVTLENTSAKKFTSGLDQSLLTTSFNENIQSSLKVSDEFGYIEPGEMKEGEILFFPQETQDIVSELKWVEWIFQVRMLDENNKQMEPKKEYEVKMKIK